jgi:glycosyltransferase involved in cell wall biosynthesis
MPGEAGVRDVIDGVQLFNSRSTGVAGFPLAVSQQTGIIDRLRPSAVHVFKPKGYGGLSGWFRRGRFPLLVDSDDWEGDGGWNQAGNYSALQRRLFNWQERRLLRDARAVTAASHLLARRASSLRGSSCDVTWVPNGLDPQWASRLADARSARAHTNPDQTTIVFYSRFAEFQADWLPRFVSALSSRLDSTEQTRVVVIGSDSLTHVSDPNVCLEHMGYVALERVPELLGDADIAVYPYHDTLISRSKNSVKLLELMCAGCAIVAAGVGDVPAVGGDTVALADSNDPRTYAALTIELIRNPGQRRHKAAAAQRRARSHFEIPAVTQRLVDAYRRSGLAL